MSSLIDRLGYAAGQGARVAWYAGHYLALNRMRGPLRPEGETPRPPSGQVPGRDAFIGAIRELFERDWANVEAGHYPAPREMPTNIAKTVERSIRFFRDARRVDERRLAREGTEVRAHEDAASYPTYYRQNFHYQTDGYLSEDSAKLYDTQVEVLFAGAAAAMRRQALVPLSKWMAGRDQRSLALLDVACGTGRFLSQVKEAFPRLPVTGVDLSPAYVAQARRTLRRRGWVTLMQGNAEQLPVPDASQDLVTCVYLFHELPPKVRRIVAGELARVLKPGGRLVLVDALQAGDRPSFDGLLDLFPVGFHEPYFRSYLKEDLCALFGAHGLAPAGETTAFLSKVAVFDKA